MKKTKKVISLLLTLALIAGMLSVAVVSTSAAANPYSEAAQDLDAEYAYDGELGALYSPEATTFKVWAPLATEVKLNRYATGSDKEDGAANLGTVEMEKLMDGDVWTGVWTTTVSGDIVNTYYTYSITNPRHIYSPEDAVDLVTRETQDVYSKAVGVNGDRSMVVDLSSAAANPDGWENDSHVFVDHQTDAIIWEIQVKDFSYNENSGVSAANRGKFMAFTETGTTLNNEGTVATCIDYLKQLGITHVQINPFYDFATINEAGDDSQFNWGYDPKNYGVPEGSYSTNPFDGNVRIKEAKAMIQALHEAGIGVIMDVVYNHTYSIDSCFTYTVPEYYYRLRTDGSYVQGSGCGNDTASERAMYRKYMREMLLYWTEEYHIDGYRFDLMGLHDGETMNLIREDLDDLDSRILMYGEGWTVNGVGDYDATTCAGTDTYMTVQSNTDMLSSRIGFFNDQIRDGIKGGVFDGPTANGFVTGSKVLAPEVAMGIRANTVGKGRWPAQTPEQTVTYASCHDNMTLYDKLAAATEKSSVIDYRARYAKAIASNKLAGAIVNTSQGIDFLLAGEEMGRSKDGDENSYKSAATLNMIDWSLLQSNADLVSYYKGLFELRKSFSPFTASVTQKDGGNYEYFVETSGSVDTIVYTLHNNTEGEWNKIAVFLNGANTEKTYTFKSAKLRKDKTIDENTEWVIVVNDKAAGVTKLDECKGLTFTLPANSALVAVEKTTFEETDLQSDFSKITLNNVYESTGEILSSTTVIGRPGEGYSVKADNSVPIEYELSNIDGATEGVFTDEDQVVNFNYIDYVPLQFRVPNGDIDDSGEVDVLDVTVLQRFLCELIQLDEEHEKRGDYDASGDTDIPDATMLQRYLADMVDPVYTITTRHATLKEDGTKRALTTATEIRLRYGEQYTTSPQKIAYYTVDQVPANATGVVTCDKYVEYLYVYSVASPIMHVKHSGDATWDPTLWAWAYGTDGSPINCYTAWPGNTLSKGADDEWYDITFPIPGGLDYYFIISNNGTPQTKDYGPISYDDYPEIWVVINDDDLTRDDMDWCKFYNYNPDFEN